MKTCETTKLFYSKYCYKLEVYTRLAAIFRDKNFAYSRKIIDIMNHKDKWESQTDVRIPYWAYNHVSSADLKDARYLFKEFTSQDYDSFKLRVELSHLSIYSNNRDWLLKLSKKASIPLGFWEPKIQLEENTVFLKEPIPFEYRVTMRRGTGNSAFAEYATKNPELIKISPAALSAHTNEYNTEGLYFYVKSHKVLTIVQLMLPSLIRRVDKVKYR